MKPTDQTFMEAQVNACLAPVPKERPSVWCVNNLNFDEAQNHGPFTLAGNEYCADVLDDFGRLTLIQETLVWGSQTKKTGTIMGGVAWKVKNDPCGVLWAMPTQPLAQSFSETRWQKMLRASEQLEALIPSGAARHRFKNLEQQFKSGAVVNFVGSNSPANLASRPARLAVGDEVDKFDSGGGGEADAVDLLKQRTKGQVNPQHWLTSTPTMVEGLIWQEYLKGNQSRYNVPCPLCEKKVTLAWSKAYNTLPKAGNEAYVIWDKESRRKDDWDLDRVFRSARFQCPHCGGDIPESKKTWMVRDGVWVATNSAAAPGYVSRHLSSLYANSPSTSCGALAVKFLQAKNSLLGLQGFINGDLAEPYQSQDRQSERVELVTTKFEVTEEWKKLMTIDCQQKAPYFWYVVRAWNGGNSKGLKAGSCDTWDELRSIQTAQNIQDCGVMVDSGYGARSEAEVYRTCARFGEIIPRGSGRQPAIMGWMPSKGMPTRKRWKNDKGVMVPYFIRALDPFLGTGEAGQITLDLFEFSAEFFKDILENLRKGKGGYKWEVVEGMMDNMDEYWRHLDGQIRQQTLNKLTGRVTTEWARRSRHWPDHLFACEYGQCAEANFYELFSLE